MAVGAAGVAMAMGPSGGAIVRIEYDDDERFEGLTEEDYPHVVYREQSMEHYLGSRRYWKLKDPSQLLPSYLYKYKDYEIAGDKSGTWSPGEDERPGARKKLIDSNISAETRAIASTSKSRRKRQTSSPTPEPEVEKSSIEPSEPTETAPAQPPVKRRRTTVTKPVMGSKPDVEAPSEAAEPSAEGPATESKASEEKPA